MDATHHETVIGRLYLLNLPPTTYAALTAVVAHTSPADAWTCFPSYGALMDTSRIGSRNTLAKHLNRLVREGFLVKTRRANRATNYQLTETLFRALSLRGSGSLPFGRTDTDTASGMETDTSSSTDTDTLTDTTEHTPSNRHQTLPDTRPSQRNLGEDGLLRHSDATGALDSQWQLKVGLCRRLSVSGAEPLSDDEYALAWSAYHHEGAKLRSALSPPEFNRVKDFLGDDF